MVWSAGCFPVVFARVRVYNLSVSKDGSRYMGDEEMKG